MVREDNLKIENIVSDNLLVFYNNYRRNQQKKIVNAPEN